MPQNTTAAAIMTKKLHKLSPDTSVMDAVAMLLKQKISGAPVVDGNGALVGILSELDCVNHICHCAMTDSPPLDVADLMTKDIYTVGPETTLLTLAHVFSTKRYRRLPVVDSNGRLLGQLSRRDLMRALFEIMKVQQSKNTGPLYLSAIYDSDEAPAHLSGSSPSTSS